MAIVSSSPLDDAVEDATGNPAEGFETLLDRAYKLRYDHAMPPPSEELSLLIDEYPIGAAGNLTVVQGKSKAGKSAFLSAVLGAVLGGTDDTFCMKWVAGLKGAIIHLDTEQSLGDWHALVGRGLTRSGLLEAPDRLVSFPLIAFSRSERRELLRQVLAKEIEQHDCIAVVIIDGIADLCASPNDEAEALQLVSEIHALAQEYCCMIVCVLHENPGTDNGKTRGHLGSELNRKAFANLRIDKDSDSGISTVWGTDMRKREIPKREGFCFGWDKAFGMHKYRGRAEGVKAAKREEEKEQKAREFFGPIFAAEDSSAPCPGLSVDDVVRIHRGMPGTDETPSFETVKKRVQRAEKDGVLRKTQRGRWVLVPSGTNGT